MSAEQPEEPTPSAEQGYVAAQNAALDAVREHLVADARSWAQQLQEISALTVSAEFAGGHARHSLALELAGSWQVGQLAAERWVGEARRFSEALPATLAMLEAGELLRHQAVVLLHRTQHCTAEIARQVEAELLPAGAALCPSDLKRKVDRAVLRIESASTDAATAEQRHADAVSRRRTWARPDLDGMGIAAAVLPAEKLVGWAAGMEALERRERLADRAAGIERTADQRRADLFAALPAMVLAGTEQDAHADAAGHPRRPWTFDEQICGQLIHHVHVPVSTVLDLSREPGSLDGFGPVSAEHIRLLRPTALRRVMVQAHTGRPIAVDDRPTPVAPDPAEAVAQIRSMLRPDVVVDADEPQHDPSTRLARLVDLRDVRCAGPGCSSSRCDRDHLEPYPDGPTRASNLGLLSRRCHLAKHSGFDLTRHADGSVTWHSPLQRRYDRPGPYEPPPEVDLYAELPLRRARPRGELPDSRDSPLIDHLGTEPPPAPAPADDLDDEPPF